MHSIKNWRPWVNVIAKIWEVMEGHGKRENRTYSHHQDNCLFNVLPASLLMEKDVDLLMGIKRVKLLLLIFYTTTAKISPPIPPRSKHFYIHHVILVSYVYLYQGVLYAYKDFSSYPYIKKKVWLYTFPLMRHIVQLHSYLPAYVIFS